MGNLFDGLAKKVVHIANETFGYVCTWTSSQSSPAQTEVQKVLINGPDVTRKKYGFGQTFGAGESLGFDVGAKSMEYSDEYFIGLMESVKSSNTEYVNIKEIGSDGPGEDFYVRKATRIHDGKMIVAILVLKK